MKAGMLAERQPSIKVSEGVAKTWIQKYRLPPGGVRLKSAEELEQRYGAAIRHLVAEHKTGYELGKVLLHRTPPVCVTGEVCNTWIKKYGGAAAATEINSAGRLELLYGQKYATTQPPLVWQPVPYRSGW